METFLVLGEWERHRHPAHLPTASFRTDGSPRRSPHLFKTSSPFCKRISRETSQVKEISHPGTSSVVEPRRQRQLEH